MSISAIFANDHFKKKKFCAVFRAMGYGRHGQLLCLLTWVKGLNDYMTEFGLMGLIS